jgi:hypothetical protein
MDMNRRLPLVLAIVLACSTVLAGVPSIAGSAPRDSQAGPCLAPEPVDVERLSELRGENVEEEREEEQRSGDAELDLFVGRRGDAVLDMRRVGLVAHHSFQAATGSFEWGRSIRGPPDV